MYRYNDNGKLITSPIPLQGLTPVTMTDSEAKHCIGFDSDGNPIYSQAAIDAGTFTTIPIVAAKGDYFTFVNNINSLGTTISSMTIRAKEHTN